MTRTGWSNTEWLEALGGAGPYALEAHEALHAALRDGLRRAFASRPDVLMWIEDFAQDTTIHVLRDLPKFRGDSSFVTWALSIAVRLSFDELRRKRWKDISLDVLVASGDNYQPAVLQDQEKDMARQQALNALQQAMTRLTEKQRAALTAELKEMPQTEIASQLGLTRNAVYKLTYDARKSLKHALNESGITAETIAWAFASDQRSSR